MKTITLLTEPISLNLMYRGRRFSTPRGKTTKRGMQGEILTQASNIGLIEEDVALNVMFYFKDERKRDIDSHLKCLLDSMTGIIYRDDSQITELHVFKEVDKKNPRTVVQIL